jgi:hypothetical protein
MRGSQVTLENPPSRSTKVNDSKRMRADSESGRATGGSGEIRAGKLRGRKPRAVFGLKNRAT